MCVRRSGGCCPFERESPPLCSTTNFTFFRRVPPPRTPALFGGEGAMWGRVEVKLLSKGFEKRFHHLGLRRGREAQLLFSQVSPGKTVIMLPYRHPWAARPHEPPRGSPRQHGVRSWGVGMAPANSSLGASMPMRRLTSLRA